MRCLAFPCCCLGKPYRGALPCLDPAVHPRRCADSVPGCAAGIRSYSFGVHVFVWHPLGNQGARSATPAEEWSPAGVRTGVACNCRRRRARHLRPGSRQLAMRDCTACLRWRISCKSAGFMPFLVGVNRNRSCRASPTWLQEMGAMLQFMSWACWMRLLT